ncbi:hypothetical protein [Sphingobium yanoikuyae]|uniref:hypothetical protein n=1 Tax=Sphingobium yanoikuyae TaxID=13690 RepID=UPI0031DCCD41
MAGLGGKAMARSGAGLTRAARSREGTRAGSDEGYILDLCDILLGRKGLRQYRFDFLRGDPSATGIRRRLPVDAWYPDLNLVVEYRERQHSAATPFWDRKNTLSGCNRAEQRRRYDQRRREILPANGITLVEIDYSAFATDGRGRLRRVPNDRGIILTHLTPWCGS